MTLSAPLAPGRQGPARRPVLPWLAPGAVAAACGGRVLRAGAPACGVSADTRTLAAGDLFVALRGPTFDGHSFVADALARGARGALVVREAGREAQQLPAGGGFLVEVPDTAVALLRLARVHRDALAAAARAGRKGLHVVGITGSCGKTSTKDILLHVLSRRLSAVGSPKSFNNAVGVPLSLFLARPGTEVAVVEIGTSAPGEIRRLAEVAAPDGAVVTNVFESHLEGLGSLEGVAREKEALLEALPAGAFAVLNGDDRFCREMAARTKVRCVLVSVEGPGDLAAADVRFNGLGTSFLLDGRIPVTIPRLGSHNVTNTLCALAAARELGMALEEAVEALADLPCTERRFEPRRCGQVLVYDDSYNMNPGSATAALRAFRGVAGPGRRIVVFGDMLELGERAGALHRSVGHELGRLGFDHLLALGRHATDLAAGAMEGGMRGADVSVVPDRAAALDALLALLREGDRVLVKASRKLELDLLVDTLQARMAEGTGGGREWEAGAGDDG